MYKEYDVVKAKMNLENNIIKKGMRGTILIIYESNPNKYEIEFVNNNNESVAILTVSEDEIESISFST